MRATSRTTPPMRAASVHRARRARGPRRGRLRDASTRRSATGSSPPPGAASSRVALPATRSSTILERLADGVSPRMLELPAGSTRRGASSTSTSRAAATRVRPRRSTGGWCGRGSRPRPARDRALPFGVTASYGEIARGRATRAPHRAAGTALGDEPDPDRRSLPPGPARRRRPRQLRRRARDEAVPARARRRDRA